MNIDEVTLSLVLGKIKREQTFKRRTFYTLLAVISMLSVVGGFTIGWNITN